MKKYITFIIAILIHMNIYAESYIFGGRTQFEGALVNQGCAIDTGSDQEYYGNKALNYFILMYFSECTEMTFKNISLSLSEQDGLLTSKLYIYPGVQEDIFIADNYSLDHMGITDFNQNDLYYKENFSHEYQYKKLGITIPKRTNEKKAETTSILISVFYP